MPNGDIFIVICLFMAKLKIKFTYFVHYNCNKMINKNTGI